MSILTLEWLTGRKRMFERAPKEQIQSIEIIIASNEDKRMEKRILHIWNNVLYIISRLKIFKN